MKKTLNVNLNGSVFTIDEDAFVLLDNYLSNLRIYFRKEEGAAEIIADFEARIAELFSEKTRLGYQVITFEHVEEVIARVGKPADFAGNEEKEEKQTHFAEPEKIKKKLFRNTDDKLLGGVCSGIAAYFGWSTTAVRIITLILPFVLASVKLFSIMSPPLFFTSNLGFLFILAYLVAWMIVPGAQTAEQKLQMHGKPITVENIGKTVAAQSAPVAPREPKGCVGGFVDIIVGFLKVCLIGLGCLIGIPILFALFIVVIVLIAVFLGIGGGLIGAFPPFLTVEHPVLSMIAGILVLGIPVVAIIYSIIAFFAKAKPLGQPVKWIVLLVWILSVILFFSSGLRFNADGKQWFGNNNWPFFSEIREIRGNQIPSHKTIDFDEDIRQVELGRYFNATIYIEQALGETPSIEIRGDENLVEQVKHDLYDGRLVLTAHNRIHHNNNLSITLRTNALSSLQMGSVGSIRMKRAFTGDVLDIRLRGVGNFEADSLYVNSLTVRTEGVGSANIAGKTGNVRLETAGVGKIDALELVADTVYARVDGVGNILCNPVEFLEGRSQGVGSITYKEEPKNKNVSSSGVGKIRKR